MEKEKIFIVCDDKDLSLDICKKIILKNDEVSIIPIFSTDTEYYDEISENYIYYLDTVNVNLSYKNNALLYILTNNYISHGITLDDFYNNDIAFMNIEEYNNIPDVIFKKYDILTIWIDTKHHNSISKKYKIELKYFNERINEYKYMYFLSDDTNIEDIINSYIVASEENKKEILKNNL